MKKWRLRKVIRILSLISGRTIIQAQCSFLLKPAEKGSKLPVEMMNLSCSRKLEKLKSLSGMIDEGWYTGLRSWIRWQMGSVLFLDIMWNLYCFWTSCDFFLPRILPLGGQYRSGSCLWANWTWAAESCRNHPSPCPPYKDQVALSHEHCFSELGINLDLMLLILVVWV